MMRGVGGVRKSIHQSWLAKGLGLLCWDFKGVQEDIPSKEASTLQIGCGISSRTIHQSTTLSLSQSIWPRWVSRQFLSLRIVQTLLPVTFSYSLSSQAVVMRQLRRWKRPTLIKSGKWHFQLDNAPVHNSILVTDYLTKMGINTVPQPPYSPDLAPCDFWLFPKLTGCRYETIEEVKKAVTKVIDTLTQEDFHGAFEKLLERYNKCIAGRGDYFEGDKSSMCVVSIKVPIRKKSGNLFNDPRKWQTQTKLMYTYDIKKYLEIKHQLEI